MLHKCFDCFYKTDFGDKDDLFPICEREWWSYKEAKDECEKPGPCKYRLTHEEMLKFLDKAKGETK